MLRFERVEYNADGERYVYNVPTFLRFDDFKNFYVNRRVEISNDKTMSLGVWWLTHRQRRRNITGSCSSRNRLRLFAANSTCGADGASSQKRAIGR